MDEKLKEITIDNKELFDSFFKTVNDPIADLTFAMRLIWAEPVKHTWTIINDHLCVFGFLRGKHVIWGPILPSKNNGKFNETLERCFQTVEKLNSHQGIHEKPLAIYIPESLKAQYQDIDGTSFSNWTQDYVYEITSLIGLAGKQFQSKRRELNIFTRNSGIEVEHYDFSKHGSGCSELIDDWKNQKDAPEAEQNEDVTLEYGAAKRLITFSSLLPIEGVVAKIHGKIIGLALGEKLTSDTASKIIQKNDFSIRGSSDFVFREYAKHFENLKFLDAQDDFCLESLKRTKMSYNPAKLIKSYSLEKK